MQRTCHRRSILGIVREHIPRGHERECRRVAVRIGPLAGVIPDSLEFCFEALVHETPFARARLAIELVPMRARCDRCGAELESAEPAFACPAAGARACGSPAGGIVQVSEIGMEEEVA